MAIHVRHFTTAIDRQPMKAANAKPATSWVRRRANYLAPGQSPALARFTMSAMKVAFRAAYLSCSAPPGAKTNFRLRVPYALAV
jgi:hypothetical protein